MMSEKRFQKKLLKMQMRGERYRREKEVVDTYVEYIPDKKKRKVSNVMLVIIVAAIVSYTVACFWIQYATGTVVDSTLTTLFYGFWTVELISLTAIKNHKTKYSDSSDENCG